MVTKVCTKCQVEKEISGFHNCNTKGKYGVVAVCKPCASLKYHLNKDSRRDRALQRLYGLSMEDYLGMLEGQQYACLICSVELIDGSAVGQQSKPHIDHCHTTGKVRGILCSHCNPGLGYFGDDIDTLKKAIAYLEKN